MAFLLMLCSCFFRFKTFLLTNATWELRVKMELKFAVRALLDGSFFSQP